MQGPDSYRNWRACIEGIPAPRAIEVPLYSDAWIVGQILEGMGPYQLLNAWRLGPRASADPVVYLRIANHIPYTPGEVDWSKVDDSGFTGTWEGDEIACLLALSLGARIMAGGISREFPESDPRGYAVHSEYRPALQPSPFGSPKVLPSAGGQRELALTSTLTNFPSLSPKAALVVIRAARAYRDALWFADTEPEIAWLLLVAALEAAAVFDASDEAGSPGERLKVAKPEIARLLEERGGQSLLDDVAVHLADLLKATARFINFTMKHLPTPPSERPSIYSQLDWTPSQMKKTFSKVYGLRSKALHDGVPFPPPICQGPRPQPNELPHEVIPTAQGAIHTLGGLWPRETLPLYLHTFAYIARGVLLNWWASLASDTRSTSAVGCE